MTMLKMDPQSKRYFIHGCILASYPGRCGGTKDGLVSTVCTCAQILIISRKHPVIFAVSANGIDFVRVAQSSFGISQGRMTYPTQIFPQYLHVLEYQKRDYTVLYLCIVVSPGLPENLVRTRAHANSRYQAVFSIPTTTWITRLGCIHI